MIKIIVSFLFLYVAFFLGILGFRQLTGKQKMELVKMLTYSALCATITIAVLTVFVMLF